MEHKEPSKDYEIFMYKNRLQEFTQKSAIPLPEYRTFNEGEAHAPRFRSTVLVDGVTYTSPHSFFHRRASQQDVAKIALEILSKKIESENENEGVSFILKDATFCKSILHEYAVKMNLGKPTYTTSRAEGIVPVFTSSSHFNGQTYTGDLAKSKKEAEQLAAHAVIESILANSNTRTLMCEIIRSKGKLYATFCKKDSSPGLSSERNVPSRSHTQNDTVNGKIVFVNSTNTKVPEMICSGDEKIAKSTATETFTPEAKKFKEEYTCELSSGTNGNGSSQPTLPLGGSMAASNTSNPSEGPLAHVQVNNGEKLIEPSTNRPEDSQDVVLSSGIRRSDTAENEGNKSKKARIIEQSPTPAANLEELSTNA